MRQRRVRLGLAATIGLLFCWVSAGTVAAGTFERVGDMTAARYRPEAVLLTDDTVLVTGGTLLKEGQEETLASAELFDPKTNTFRALPPMTRRRETHQMTLLKDGRVLITGGYDEQEQSVRKAVEIFDPVLGGFIEAGEMMSPRAWHSATLLPDGKVLIAGGLNDATTEVTGELFDPVTGAFQTTGEMWQPRYRFTTVALPDGRVVFLAGNVSDGEATRTVDLYDPKTNLFIENGRGELAESRWLPTAVILSDNRILVVAGGQPTSSSGDDVPLNSAEIYDPSTGKSTHAGELRDPRMRQIGLRLADGRVLVAGGVGKDGAILRSAEVIDPVTGSSTPTGAMTTARSAATAVLLRDGRVLVVGGWDGQTSYASAEVSVP